MVAHDPLSGSGRAGLPHPPLASGSNAKEAMRSDKAEPPLWISVAMSAIARR